MRIIRAKIKDFAAFHCCFFASTVLKSLLPQPSQTQGPPEPQKFGGFAGIGAVAMVFQKPQGPGLKSPGPARPAVGKASKGGGQGRAASGEGNICSH